jgi:acyl carrier protein
MVRERVKQFIIENFYVADPSCITDDTSLIDEGFVDSTGMLEVIAFIESEFGVSISDLEMTPENLETIGRIARFVSDKQAKRADADSETTKAS